MSKTVPELGQPAGDLVETAAQFSVHERKSFPRRWRLSESLAPATGLLVDITKTMAAFTGKSVLITGGGSGIGQATAKLFLQAGASVAIAGRNQAKLDETARQIGGERLYARAADIADPQQAKDLVQAVERQFKKIDVLVNNAGTNIKERGFRELSPEVWQRLIRTNLDGAFYCIHAVFPGMAARKDGLIININSIAGKRATPLGGIAYAASKFGMTALGIGLGAEEKDSGVRFCNIYPGEVDTPILEHRPTS
jgi:NAD(P)-dependent dehydrogenase (short-subunit alcohol dehydrogenase family)